MKNRGRTVRRVALTIAFLALAVPAQGATYSVDPTGPMQFPGTLIPPLDAPWGPNGYPGDTVELLGYAGVFNLSPGSYIQQINTLHWTIDYTYGGATEPWPDMLFPFNTSSSMSIDGTPGTLSQSGLLTVNYFNDFISMLLGTTTSFLVGSYQVDVTPLGFTEPVAGSNFDGDNPWVQPDIAVMARFDVTAAAVPEPASLVVWSLIALTVGGVSWWRRRNRVG